MKHCNIVWLVGLEDDLPADKCIGHFRDDGYPPIIGCNNLICMKCRSLVKHVDSRRINQVYPPPREDLIALHMSADPASSSLLQESSWSRTYFCRCDWASVGDARSLNHLDQDWACGGHDE